MPGPNDNPLLPTEESAPTAGVVHVISPLGVLGTIPESDLDIAGAEGYSLATPEQIENQKLKKEYGGFVKGAEATVLGAARGLTAGLSDVAITEAAGLIGDETSQEATALELKRLKEQRPYLSGAGEIGGMIGGLAIGTGEAGAAGSAARLGSTAARGLAVPVAGIEALGKGAGALAGAIPGVVGRWGAPMARAAVEGAGYELGMGLSENALENKELIGENLWANSKRGALLGAGVVGGGKLLGAIAKPTIGGARRIIGDELAPGILPRLQEKLGIGEASFNAKLMSSRDVQDRLIYKADEIIDQKSRDLADKLTNALKKERSVYQISRDDLKSPIIEAHIAEFPVDTLPSLPKNWGSLSDAKKLAYLRKKVPNLPKDIDLDAAQIELSKRVNEQKNFVFNQADNITNSLKEIEADLYAVGGVGKRAKQNLDKAVTEITDITAIRQVIEGFDKVVAAGGIKAAGKLAPFVSRIEATGTYLAADNLKRQLGYFTSVAENGARKGGAAGSHWRRIHEKLATAYDDIKKALERQDLWGKAGKYQKLINGGDTTSISYQRQFFKNFITEMGRDEGVTGVWKVGRRGDPGKLKSHLSGLHGPDKDLPQESIEKWIQGRRESSQALLDSLKAIRGDKLTPTIINRKKNLRMLLEDIKSIEDDLRVAKTHAKEKSQYLALIGQSGSGRGLINALAAGGVASGNWLAAAGAASSIIADPVWMAKRIHGLSSVAEWAGKRIKGDINSVARTAQVASHILHKTDYEEANDKLRKEALELQKYSTPQAIAKDVYKAQTFSPETPGVNEAFAGTGGRAHAFLANAAPSVASMQNMMGPPPGASKTELKEFERLKKIATDPTAILAELKSGKISPSQVLALKTIYPATHAEIVKETNDMLIKNRTKGKDLPYKERLAVGTLIPGAEPSLDPSYIRTMQGVYSQQKAAAPPTPKPTGQRADSQNTRISLREPRET